MPDNAGYAAKSCLSPDSAFYVESSSKQSSSITRFTCMGVSNRCEGWYPGMSFSILRIQMRNVLGEQPAMAHSCFFVIDLYMSKKIISYSLEDFIYLPRATRVNRPSFETNLPIHFSAVRRLIFRFAAHCPHSSAPNSTEGSAW